VRPWYTVSASTWTRPDATDRRKWGRVGQAHGHLVLVPDDGAGADAGCALDGGGVDASVDDSPGGMVIRAELDVPENMGGADLVEDESSVRDKRASGFKRRGFNARSRRW